MLSWKSLTISSHNVHFIFSNKDYYDRVLRIISRSSESHMEPKINCLFLQIQLLKNERIMHKIAACK